MGVRQKIRHLQRYRDIAHAFVRSGFGYMVEELGLPSAIPFARRDDSAAESSSRTIGERIRNFLEELGPTFVKLGQIASTRPDLIPAEIIAELERLQDHVAPFPYEEVAAIIESELGAPVEQLFASFDEAPMAAASIGQVHRAELPDGTPVAVKVQRPRIGAVIETDLDILSELARLAESRMAWARSYRIGDMIEELARALRREMDYTAEARHMEKFAALEETLDYIRVPGLYRTYSTRKVLTMDYIEGIKLSERERLDHEGIDRKRTAERYATAILHQILIDGLFHCDPHPGNVLALPDGKLALIDFGMVGKLSPEMKRHFASFVIALRAQSTNGVLRSITRMGLVPDEADMDALRDDVDELRDKYYRVPLHEIGLGEAIRDLFAVARRHGIRIPVDMTLLGKTLLTMEGVVAALDPSFSVFDVAEPFGRRLLRERFDPRHMAKEVLGHIPEYIDLAQEIPAKLREVAAFAKKGKISLEITAPELDQFLRKLERISNRVTFSIILLAFSIIMVGLIIGSSMGRPDLLLWKVPIIEIGFGFAVIMFGWLLLAIFRSGRF